MILSIDTFSDVLGICLLDENKDLKFFVEYRQYKPFSETIIYELDILLRKFEIKKEDIKAIVVNKGPGGYTGLRVGIITAKTLAYALNTKLFAYTSLDAMFYPYKNLGLTIITAVNAGKGNVYIKKFSKESQSDILVVPKEKIQQHLKGCSFCIQKNLNLEGCFEKKNSLALEGALFALEKNLEVNPFELEPIYPL